MTRSREYRRTFTEQNLELGDEDAMFIPSKRAKYRHPEVASFDVEGRIEVRAEVGEGLGIQNNKPPLQPKRFGNVDNPQLLAFLIGFKIYYILWMQEQVC